MPRRYSLISIAAAEGAGLLVLAHDGDRARLGPRSLGPASRLVVDHAPCPVLLVWTEPAPGIATIPPPRPHPPHRRQGAALASPAARPFDVGRGPSPGWVLIAPGGSASDQDLAAWIQQALAFATTLPAK